MGTMTSAVSSLDSQHTVSRSASAFPAARIGSPGPPPEASTNTATNTSISASALKSTPQFGSVGLSSTAVTNNSIPGSVSSADYDPSFVRTIGRHLVSPKPSSPASYANSFSKLRRSSMSSAKSSARASPAPPQQQQQQESEGDIDPNFYDLTLQGGDITRELYNWQRVHADQAPTRKPRSRSFSDIPRPQVEDDTLNIHNINVPGGFRRNYLLSKARGTESQTGYGSNLMSNGAQVGESSANASGLIVEASAAETFNQPRPRPFLTRNFLEFLSVYGHFAGESLEEDDDDQSEGDEFSEYGETSTIRSTMTADDGLHQRLRRHLSRTSIESGISDMRSEVSSINSVDEESGLLGKRTVGVASKHRSGQVVQDTSATKAVLLLLKGFVGTGVLFLPKAYYNGGMLFSSAILFFVAVLTYYCFILLIDSRMVVNASFGDMGGILYGKKVRMLILTSIVLSQIGFAAAYTVFTSENLQAFIMAITDCRVLVPVRYLIFLQLIVFVPLSMVRNISKLSLSALIADFFILLGLAYVYFWDGRVLVEHGVSDIAAFNSKDWTLFIGTAIFTFEGIGLVIPIHESMHKPQQFYAAIGIVMAIITLVYISMGILSYAAYGSNVETVVILNMPQDNRLVNSVQFIYAMAILLSTPLQLFPAIRIMENAWFPKSGKHDMRAKWTKNVFRTGIVLITAFVAWGGADDLDKFVALIGSFACIPLTYIYPPLLHYRACANTTFMKSMDVFICLFGLGSMIYTTLNTIESWATSEPDNDFFRYCS
ncbi:transmembrane amino acid transporter protein-domain-containing protein [Myxozyma melibiosi]|uniref:Transmembrane amino acid transporter protein-domain-containing protein n=1 Tax=Myxozyma melibiosi TaxID=54550 RepID=A0ABR1F775_9ASCO